MAWLERLLNPTLRRFVDRVCEAGGPAVDPKRIEDLWEEVRAGELGLALEDLETMAWDLPMGDEFWLELFRVMRCDPGGRLQESRFSWARRRDFASGWGAVWISRDRRLGCRAGDGHGRALALKPAEAREVAASLRGLAELAGNELPSEGRVLRDVDTQVYLASCLEGANNFGCVVRFGRRDAVALASELDGLSRIAGAGVRPRGSSLLALAGIYGGVPGAMDALDRRIRAAWIGRLVRALAQATQPRDVPTAQGAAVSE